MSIAVLVFVVVNFAITAAAWVFEGWTFGHAVSKIDLVFPPPPIARYGPIGGLVYFLKTIGFIIKVLLKICMAIIEIIHVIPLGMPLILDLGITFSLCAMFGITGGFFGVLGGFTISNVISLAIVGSLLWRKTAATA